MVGTRFLKIPVILTALPALLLILSCRATEAELADIRLPPGFRIDVYAETPHARSLALGDNGTVFVSTRRRGVVYAFNGDAGEELWFTNYGRGMLGDDLPPDELNHGQVFVAEHGSWKRSKKIGYRISLVQFDQGSPASYEVFAEGWLQGESVSGRPVDLLVLPDGLMLVSDDQAGKIYRIYHEEND